MILGRKGQGDWKWIVGVVVAVAISVAVLMIWNYVIKVPFPTTPEQYANAWKDYGEYAFDTTKDDQPWRVLSIFFFPLITYFTLFFGAICLVFAQGNIRSWNIVQRPFILFAFAVSFIILPFPTTFWLYQSLGAISVFVPFVAWIIMLGFIVLLLRYMSLHFGGAGAPSAPGAPGAPSAPALPAIVNVNLMNASNDLRQFAMALANLRR